MIKSYLMKSTVFNTILCVITILITLFLIVTGEYIQEGYDMKIGSVSPKKFIATDEIENKVATQKLIDEAKASITPLYIHDANIQKKVIDELNNFFEQTDKFLEDLNKKQSNSQSEEVPDAYIYQSLSPETSENKTIISSKVYLTQTQLDVLRNLNDTQIKNFKSNIINVTNATLEQGIREDSQPKSLSYIKEEIEGLGFNQQLSNLAYIIISSVIEPNLIVDDAATQKARENKVAEVVPIMILKNQKIIDEGEIISEETYEVLNSLGYINKNSIFENIVPITGIYFIVTILCFTIFFYLYTFHIELCNNKREILLILTIYILTICITRLFTNIPFVFTPILLFTMIVAITIDINLAIILNFAVTILCALIYKGDSDFIIYFLITGTLTAMTSKYTTERNRIFFIGIINAFSYAIVMAGITLLFDKIWDVSIIKNLIYAFASGIILMILAVGSLPLWEAIFGIVTSVKLLDLINPNKELLRRLVIETPGTYHHSLIVANLAETAACQTNANPILTRVGAYYHDIGKLKFPNYFSENIVGENPHDNMDPYASAKIIKNHVSDGIELAKTYKLPIAIKDIILQHHGNTIIKFFYYKAKEKYPNTEINENDFRYPNIIPQSKEAAIIMLADTVEAAVRSMIPKGKTAPEIKTFIDKLIKDKLDDGQLRNSQLTIKDLEVISNSFMDIFKGMYHERIPYPDKQDIDDVKIYKINKNKDK